MTSAVIAALVGAVFFAAAGFLGAFLGGTFADRITPFEDAPPQEKPPILLLIVACSALGAVIAARTLAPAQFVMIAVVCMALVAVWITDARRGIVPDVFTLGPLSMVLAVAVWQHQWWLLVSTVIPLLPFAIAALLSRGRGMGWGDVKLAALGGAVLGAHIAVVAFALACVAAAGINYARGRKQGAFAFAPYLAAAIGVAIPLGMWR